MQDFIKYFFTRDIPDDVKYNNFTWQHLILFAASVAFIVIIAFAVKKMDSDKAKRVTKIFAICIPLSFAVRFFLFYLFDTVHFNIAERLPLHICGVNAILMPAAVLTKNKTLLNLMYGISLPGAAAALVFSTTSVYGVYAAFSVHLSFYFIDHALMILVVILTLVSGMFKPDVKNMPKALLMLVCYCAVIFPLNKLLGSNYVYLNRADAGTPMVVFEKWLGNPGYILPTAVMAIMVMFLMYLPYLFKKEKITKSRAVSN